MTELTYPSTQQRITLKFGKLGWQAQVGIDGLGIVCSSVSVHVGVGVNSVPILTIEVPLTNYEIEYVGDPVAVNGSV